MKTDIGRIFNFGKYKGNFILDVIRKNPSYIEWLLLNTKFKINNGECTFFKQVEKDFIEAFNNVKYAFKRGKGASKDMYKTVEAYKRGEIKPLPKKIPSLGDLKDISVIFSNSDLCEHFEDDDIFRNNQMELFN